MDKTFDGSPEEAVLETDAIAELTAHIQESIDAELAAAFLDGALLVDICEDHTITSMGESPVGEAPSYDVRTIRWYRSDPPAPHEPAHPADRLERVTRYDLTSVSTEAMYEAIDAGPVTMSEIRDRI